MNLIENEKINISEISANNFTELTDSQIDEKYVQGEVRIVLEQARYQLKQISDLVKSADYNLQPDFQRRPRWSIEKQSRLIESLILNVPIPPIFLYEQDFGRYEVMDGRQRLTAISQFYNSEFKLQNLKEWPELNNRSYNELPEQVRRGIDRRFLSAIVLLHETAKTEEQAEKLKQLVFERINTGGEDLSAQEKRNALFPGKMNSLCIKLARKPSLCRMWGIPEPDEDEIKGNFHPSPELLENETYKKMEDAELVLRFFAHRQRNNIWRSGNRFDEYLDFYLKSANQMPEETIEKLGQIFERTVDLVYEVLGESAFWIFRSRANEDVWVQRSTYIVYDPLMYSFSNFLDKSDKIKEKSLEIKKALPQFYKDNYQFFDGRKTNPSDIKKRDELFTEFLMKFSV